ncbi:glycosyltransferase family 4 protein [Kaistia geumhonensis]|uniref:glycosyltransferase family 4 protein n=1 Tax=Kaistia geumhonensis TaxID=410839 RepID=UPI002255DAC5|nr:glycosyltransferase family 4 protein [Kaistia geumhonensis]MCX5481259.1 glycosyltransferase family 4 protein [Kaistia geumhonensis]
MRILASAYACEPGAGSELGKGWNLAAEMARQGHDVTVLTCGSHHREAIERYRATHDWPDRLDFAWHDIPGWPGPGYANAKGIRQHYYVWQMKARRVVAELHARNRYDVIHHLTWTVLRWPSFLGGLGPRFVFGPVGGGQSSPWRLRNGFPDRGRKFEAKRDVLNMASRFDPMVLRCLGQADAILVTDEATRRIVPPWWRDKAFVVTDIYAPSLAAGALRPAGTNRGLAVLFAGRLEYWKGAQLALGALARLRDRIGGLSFTIAGSGPEEAYLRGIAADLGIEDIVRFVGSLPHAEMSRLYAAHDVFVFPSLHDSAGQAIGEAMAHGLPVVCLDLGGPGVVVDETCGVVVPTRGRSRTAVESALADALAEIGSDTGRLASLQTGARARATRLSYEQRVQDLVRSYY